MGKIFEPLHNPLPLPRQEELDYNGISGFESLYKDINYDTDASILPVLKRLVAGFTVDYKWCRELHKYVYNFTTRRIGDTDYSEFFDSPYIGLQKITFTTADVNQWFTEIFDVDEQELKEHLHACRKVNKDWHVTGDVFNLTIPYLMYMTHHSDVSKDVKEQALLDLVCIYHYKCLTSILHNDYQYLAKKEVAYETYNRLSLKYDIKRYGSWRKLIEARARFIIDPKTGIHYKTFTKMDDDAKIIYMVGDIQDRLRGVINDINAVFHDVKNKTNIVKLESSLVNINDNIGVKDVTKEVNKFKNHIVQALASDNGFYKAELVTYASKALANSPEDKLEHIVKSFSSQYNSVKGALYVGFVEEVTTHCFEYLRSNNIKLTNLKDVLLKMRGGYLSPRTTNSSVLKLRKDGDLIVKELTGIKTPITITSLRTSLMVYICLRMLAMNSYI